MNNKDYNHNVVSSEDASSIIENTVKALIDNPSLANRLPAILLRGGAGIGKSTIVKHIAEKLGIGFVDVRLPQMDRCDFSGLPSVENNSTKWNIPAFWPTDKNSAGIMFFDEITAAPADVQVAAYSVILDRMVPNTGYHLPDKWFIVAAGNRTCDRAVVKTMSSALANRFMHIDLEPNVEDWRQWAVENSIDPSVVGYINYRPSNLFKMDGENLEAGWPSPRSWEKVSNMLSIFKNTPEVLQKIVYGLVGPGVGTEFMAFHKLQKNFDNIEEIMTNPDAEFEIPTKSDEKYAFFSAVSYCLWNGKNEKDDQQRITGFYRILDKATPDFATMIAKLALLGNTRVSRTEAAAKMIKNPKYKEFAKKFRNTLQKKYSLN